MDTHAVKFMITTQESSPVILHTNVLPQITGPIQGRPLLEKDLEFLKAISPGKLADTIPEISKSTTETVDILVGSNYFWESENRKHQLLHHPTITPHKASTKVRIVFDSAKISKHVKSLNECLYRGPINLPDMCVSLLRLHIHCIGILGNIEKAYIHIGTRKM